MAMHCLIKWHAFVILLVKKGGRIERKQCFRAPLCIRVLCHFIVLCLEEALYKSPE